MDDRVGAGRSAGLKSVPLVNASGLRHTCCTVSNGIPTMSATACSCMRCTEVQQVPRPRARAASMKLHMAGWMLAIIEADIIAGAPSVRPWMQGMTRTGASPMCSPR